MATYISHSPADTETLGYAWGRAAALGWIIGLSGELGTGKTQLVKGLAKGLGIPARVHSPTFTLVNAYTGGRLALFRLDLYRLDTPQQILAAGLDQYLEPNGVTVIEWAERIFDIQSLKANVRSSEAGVTGPTTEVLERGDGSAPPGACHPNLRWVEFTATSESERRIIYEDFGA